MAAFSDYLQLLDELPARLEELAGIQHAKIDAVRAGDLNGLNEQMKREPALSLQLKGYERRQRALLEQLGLSGTSLLQLPGLCPPELREQTQRAVRRLHDQYQVLRSAQEAARAVLEGQLHGIQRELRRRGADPEVEAHYTPAGHTDLTV